jgi:Zn-dependent peptidase ImmA (M78 family)/plasmid maintenance system antidote protein VapI
MITLARDLIGISQNELTKQIHFTQGKLSKIENSFLKCSDEDIAIIAKALDLPVDFFYQTDNIYGLGISQLYYRKKKSTTQKELKRYESLFQVRRMQISRLLKSVEIGEVTIREFPIDEYENPSKIASMVRAMWHIPSGPIDNVVDIIENNGGIIFSEYAPDSKIDAMSQWVKNLTPRNMILTGNYGEETAPPIFFINKSKPMDRIRFSLCHELGHSIMHKIPNDEIEHQADEFAAEFLMPETDIKKSLYNLTFEKLVKLKLQWKVSIAALIHRAKELNCITENQYRYLFMKLSSMGYKTREPQRLDPPIETPTLLHNIMKVYFNDLNYTKEELSRLLLMNPEKFDSFYGNSNYNLRLVK